MNKWLKGNGMWCAACNGTGRGQLSDIFEYEGGTECRFYAPCTACGGQKRIAAPTLDVIAKTVPDTEPKVHTFWSQCIEYRSPRRRGALET